MSSAAVASARTPTSANNAPEWTVSELSGALRRTLEDRFGLVRVRGEIMGYRGPHSSGHAYFSLKDRDAKLDAVVWRTSLARLRFKPQEGLEVVATGKITTFPGKSAYQLQIEQLEPAGAGALMALLDERRRKLAAEGLFEAGRKRRLPFIPEVIGVVTSPTGAVIRDILHRLADRFPRNVLVWPVRVQGETCGDEVAAAIAGLNALPVDGPIRRPDVVIVARGGGSLEDLWGFNDEAVVRATAASAIPVIAAVGHETDWTLIDHAADMRAPTPTGAAEMAVPVRSELVGQVAGAGGRLRAAGARGVEARRTELRATVRGLPSGPDALLAPARQALDLAAARLGPALLANARTHDGRLRRAGELLARHTPRLELAAARARLTAIGERPAAAAARIASVRQDRLRSAAERLLSGRQAAMRAERLRIDRCREQAEGLTDRARRALRAALARSAARVDAQGGLLVSLGYRSVLERGYALVRAEDGRPIPRGTDVASGQALEIEFQDGSRLVRAEGARPWTGRRGRRGAPALAGQDSLFDSWPSPDERAGTES